MSPKDLNNISGLLINLIRQSIKDPVFCVSLLVILIVVWKWWGIKKIFLYSIFCGIVFFLMFITKTFINGLLGEDGGWVILLMEPTMIAVLVLGFLYFGFIKDNN